MAGILLLNFLVRPLVKKLFDSERATRAANILLRDSEARFANIVNLAADAIISVDENQRILIFNYGAEQIFGYTAAEMLGQALDRLLPERYAEAHRGHIRQFGTAPQTARHMSKRPDIFGRRRDGSEFFAEASISQVMENGKQVFTVILRDISARKQAESMLKESNERFSQITENIHEVFWMTDVSKGEMLYISPAYEVLWGRTVDSLFASPQNWIDAIHVEDRQRVLQAATTQQIAGLYDEEYRIIRPDGSIRWIHDRAFPVRNDNGEVYRITGLAKDVTERKQAEEEIRVQLNELLRWQKVMLDREGRVQQLKAEINELLRQRGEAVRYPSQADI